MNFDDIILKVKMKCDDICVMIQVYFGEKKRCLEPNQAQEVQSNQPLFILLKEQVDKGGRRIVKHEITTQR